MEVRYTTGKVLRINAPEWFELPAFRAFLNRGTHPQQQQRIASFHRYGDEPSSWSDIFIPFEAYPVGIDDNGREIWEAEGSDIYGTEELNDIWQAITDVARDHQLRHGVIWISNE